MRLCPRCHSLIELFNLGNVLAGEVTMQTHPSQLSVFRLFRYLQHVLINRGAYHRPANEHILCQVEVEII